MMTDSSGPRRAGAALEVQPVFSESGCFDRCSTPLGDHCRHATNTAVRTLEEEIRHRLKHCEETILEALNKLSDDLHYSQEVATCASAHSEKDRFNYTGSMISKFAASDPGKSERGAMLKKSKTFLESELSGTKRLLRDSTIRTSLTADGNQQTKGHWARFGRMIRRWVLSKAFEITVTVLIIVNVLLIAIQADWSVKNPTSETPMFFRVFDAAFTYIFTVELFMRSFAEGCFFLSCNNPALGRNCFDIFVVLTALLDEIVRSAQFEVPNISSMRAMRACRLVRVIRVLRVARIFHDLRIMVNGILMSMRSLLWALALLALMGFVFGVSVIEFVSTELVLMEENPESYSDDLNVDVTTFKAELLDLWGSLIGTMYTLYQAVSGGVDWGTTAEALVKISPVFGLLFCLYVAVATFCVLNIITGVFVENTKTMLAKDETSLELETIEKKKQWSKEIVMIWQSMSETDAEEIDKTTFLEGMQDKRIQELFRRVGLEVEAENEGLFELLDFDGSGLINLVEFAAGVQMLHGGAKNIDMARLRHAVGGLKGQVDGIIFAVESIGMHLGVNFDMDARPYKVASQRKSWQSPRVSVSASREPPPSALKPEVNPKGRPQPLYPSKDTLTTEFDVESFALPGHLNSNGANGVPHPPNDPELL